MSSSDDDWGKYKGVLTILAKSDSDNEEKKEEEAKKAKAAQFDDEDKVDAEERD